ncbi:MAG: hypothetical protein AB8B91_09445 [Rubripirellula sp.]
MFRLLILCAMVATQVSGQEAGQAEYTPEKLHDHFRNEALSYEMKNDEGPFQLRENPLMHWQNPERNQEQGATYIWEADGQPQVLVSIFTYEWNNVVHCRHEVISLAEGPFESRLHDELVWTPMTAGLQWTPIGESTPPSQSAARRMFQLRSLAREFEGILHHKRTGDAKLAMLPQPLLRYQSEAKGILDGAIFSFAVATDPEILLVIEAKQSDDGPLFQFAPIRSNYNALELRRKQETVWECPLVNELEQTRAAQRPWSDNPFFVFTPTNPLPTPGSIE